MDERYAPRPLAGWYMAAAVLSLLFMLLGCAALAMHVTADPGKLPLDQRVMFEAEPSWVVAASAVGFVGGALAALMLVMRRKSAEPMMLVSLVGMLVWLGGIFATPKFRDLLTTEQMAILIAVVAVTWTIFWFARHSRQRGWLR